MIIVILFFLLKKQIIMFLITLIALITRHGKSTYRGTVTFFFRNDLPDPAPQDRNRGQNLQHRHQQLQSNCMVDNGEHDHNTKQIVKNHTQNRVNLKK